MKKETLHAVLLLFLCSGFWVLMLAVVASYFGIGFAQGQQPPYPPQGTVPFFGSQPTVPPQFGTPIISNNAMLPNHAQAMYNMASGEVNVPFQIDTSRLLAFSVVVDNNVQTLTVLDPVNQSLVVYNIYLNGQNIGKCEMMSARNISGDLKYDNYNAMKPTPAYVRDIVERAEAEKKNNL